MEFVFDNDLPIYIQLVEQIKFFIISGTLAPGERLPSVRELAMQTKVNPNTMQKALGELEQQGLVFTERTNGKFVTNDALLIAGFKREYADAIAKNYLSAMHKLGYPQGEALAYLKQLGGEK